MTTRPTMAANARTQTISEWLKVFRPAPRAAVAITDPEAVRAGFRSWRKRVLITSIIGYATYYFVRKNLSVAMPVMEHELHLKKADLGLFITLHGVLYGVSKFANGFLGDRANARTFMSAGLLCSAVLNLLFGLNSVAVALGIIWMINGWFQGMGFPPCARLLTHWFPPSQLPTRMALWNISHQLGGGIIVILCGYLAIISWRACFLVPAMIALGCVALLWRTLPDTPASVGLPEVEETSVADNSPASAYATSDFKSVLVKNVFCNPYVWLMALANFFVYLMRYALMDWGPTLLTEAKHFKLTQASWMVAAFELAGLFGALAGGWLTERVFNGRAPRACVFYMLLAGVSVYAFWRMPSHSGLLSTILFCSAGFFIYGPQCLLAVCAANLATKRAAASAVGLTGLFGYASTVLSGWGLGKLVDLRGWDACFQGLLIVAAIGTVIFACAWGAKAHGYEKQ